MTGMQNNAKNEHYCTYKLCEAITCTHRDKERIL